ncbi:HAMP domain-containing sensor histidine kinase [Clostridium oceanicum]|uniref:histidine kinase n=1 Tax=Clostridium oceanicum TaxID=1543 RepID=A0ABN1JM85_9CLOT
MKRKNFKCNYYILTFLIFIGIMVFIDFEMEGLIAEYFQKEVLFDRENVTFCGSEYPRGTLYWPKVKDMITNMVIVGVLLLEITVYFISKHLKNKERKRIINQLEERISLLIKGEVPEKVEELKIIDAQVNKIIQESKLRKQEIGIEMGKKNDLVTYLAHDLKTPLTSIIGYLTILDESEVPENIHKDYIKKLLKKSYRLEDLTNQFFDITRFNLQEIPLNKTLLDGNFFLEQLTEELYPLLKKKNLKVDVSLPSDMKFYVDGSLFARVLNNLLKNAIAYSCDDSIIKIKGEIGKSNIKLFVENDGDLIDEQELKLIFEKFYRRDKSRNQSSGAGLGLAIARKIVERHGGFLQAQSTNGHTIFIISLPKSL